MVDYGNVEHLRVLERLAHELRAGDGVTIVRYRDAAGLHEFADLGERLATLSEADSADGVHVHRSRRRRAFEDQFGHGAVVVDGVGVRHAGDAREPTGSGGSNPGCDRLLVLESGFAQVDMHVDEAWSYDAVACVQNFAVAGGNVRGDLDDRSARHEDVQVAVKAVSRIYDPAVLNQ